MLAGVDGKRESGLLVIAWIGERAGLEFDWSDGQRVGSVWAAYAWRQLRRETANLIWD